MWDNVLSQGIDSCSRENATVELMVTKVSEVIGDVKTGGSDSSCSGHALVEFPILRNIGQLRSKVMLLNFRKAHFQLFRESL